MPTTLVVRIAKKSADLVTFARTNAAVIHVGITSRLAALGITAETDYAAMIQELASGAEAAAAKAVEKDQLFASQGLGYKDPAAVRDKSAHETRDALRMLRTSLAATYGAQAVATVFPPGKTPETPTLLAKLAAQVGADLPNKGKSWTPLPNAVAVIDIAGAAAKLTALANALDVDIQKAVEQESASHPTKIDRDQALTVLHDIAKGLKDIVAGTLEAAGNADLADHVSVHHHFGHDPAPQPAAPGPVTPPKTPAASGPTA